MQYITALIAALVATTSALPAPAALPEGFEPISANSLEKRTPGGVRIVIFIQHAPEWSVLTH